MISPPGASRARRLAPIAVSVAYSAAVGGLWWWGNRRHTLAALALAALLTWLTLPLAWIAGHPQEDHHIHKDPSIREGKSVHTSPFLARYGRHLLLRDWPGDFACEQPIKESIPVRNPIRSPGS